MALWLKQSTTVNIKLGPFIDSTNGYDAETALTPTVKVSKNGGNLGARNSATAIAHDADGYYTVELDATDTGTLGRLRATVAGSSTHLPVWADFMVLPANVYDSLVPGTDKLQVDLQEWIGVAPLALASQRVQVDTVALSGDATAADNAEAFFDGAGYAGTNNVIPTVTTLTNAPSDSSGVTTLLSRIAAALTITGGKVDVNDKTGFSLSAAGVQAIWDALTSALTTVGSIGKLLVDNLNATISSRLASASYTAPLDAAGTRSAVGLASANLDTQLDALPTAAENADAVWDEARAGHVGAGSFGEGVASVQGNVTGSAASVTGAVGSVTGAVGSVTGNVGGNVTGNLGGTLTSTERNAIADALLDRSAGVETNRTLRQAMRLMLAALVGKLSGAATTTVVIRDTNDTVNRVSATVDSSGNRSAVTLDSS
jgi:hypothetical protein